MRIASLAAALLFATVACKKSPPPPTAKAIVGKKTWADLSKDEKKEHMKKVVHPKMKALFSAFDGELYDDVKCALCHGENAEEKGFEMPNPDLPKLDATDGFAKHEETHGDELKFMGEKVVPTMAGLLGVPKFDPNTGKGFGCGNCHHFEG